MPGELLASVAARCRYYLAEARRGESVARLRVLHERLTELAVLKRRTRMFGGDPARITRTRAEVALLRAYAARLTAMQESAAVRPDSAVAERATETPA